LDSGGTVEGRRGKISVNDFAAGLLYFSFTFFLAVLTSYAILSSTRGPYIGYKVPHYLIVLVLTAFITTLVFIVASVIRYTKKIIYALILSFLSVTISFYLYEWYIVMSRHLSVLLLPFVIVLSNGNHSAYVIDLGQISLVIVIMLAYVIHNYHKTSSGGFR